MAIRFGQLRTVLPTSENTFIQGLQIAAHCKSVDISPVYVYSAKQQTCRSLLLMGQTDGRTLDRYIDLALLSSHPRIMPCRQRHLKFAENATRNARLTAARRVPGEWRQ